MAEILIYDAIDPYWGVSASEVVRVLRDLKGADITVRINSPGGSALDGVAIYNALSRYPGKVTVEVDGIAASAASIIAMAGSEIRVSQGAMIMIHEAWAYTQGPAEDHLSTAALLTKLNAEVAGIYAARSGKTADECLAIMAAETWMGASEAVALGFADTAVPAKTRPAPDTQASARMIAAFKNAPKGWNGGATAQPFTSSIKTPLNSLFRRA